MNRHATRNSYSNQNNNKIRTPQSSRRGTYRKQPREAFVEIPGAAFFIGKLNKNHSRERVYGQLMNLTDKVGFYMRKFDMPYACKVTKQGNLGYAFVHTKSVEEAERVISRGTLKLGAQVCEVKSYGGRGNRDSSGSMNFVGGDSGRASPESSERSSTSNNFLNPLKAMHEKKNEQTPVWGGKKFSEVVNTEGESSGRATRDTSICEEEEIKKETEIPVVQSAEISVIQPAATEEVWVDTWAAEKAEQVLAQIGEQNVPVFIQNFEAFYGMLVALPDYRVQEVERMMVQA